MDKEGEWAGPGSSLAEVWAGLSWCVWLVGRKATCSRWGGAGRGVAGRQAERFKPGKDLGCFSECDGESEAGI